MRLSDVMEASGLHGWAEAGLLAFVALFAAVLVYTFSSKNRKRFDRARSLPLDDDPPPGPGSATHERR